MGMQPRNWTPCFHRAHTNISAKEIRILQTLKIHFQAMIIKFLPSVCWLEIALSILDRVIWTSTNTFPPLCDKKLYPSLWLRTRIHLTWSLMIQIRRGLKTLIRIYTMKGVRRASTRFIIYNSNPSIWSNRTWNLQTSRNKTALN